MENIDRSQPVHAPVAPDDAKNYQATFIWGTIVNALKSGWNHAVTFASTVGFTGAVTVKDNANFTIDNTADTTKQARIDASGITTGTTCTYALPNGNTTLVGTGLIQTLTNKTLTSPTITSPAITSATVTAAGDGFQPLAVSNASTATVAMATFTSGTTNGMAVTHDKTGHLAFSQGAVPTIAAGAAAGTGPTLSVTGTDQAGVLNITTGTATSGANGVVATISFKTAMVTAPKAIIVQPVNAAAINLARNQDVFGALPTTSGWTLVAGSVALGASTAYQFQFVVV